MEINDDARPIPALPDQAAEHLPVHRRVLLPLLLFVATCVSTYNVGGLYFAVPLMLILTTHELGHFFQALRYRVPASLPYFIQRRAHAVAISLLLAAFVAVAISGYWGWSVMLLLLLFIGPRHPPTADDTVPLGTGRTILGWLTLAFVVLGFTPQPFYISR